MRLKRLSLASTTVVVAGLVTVLGPTATAAHADPTRVTLPIGDSAQLAVDAAHGHIFFAAGPDGVLVTDLSGQTVTTLASEQGADSLALSPDGSKIYVGLGSAHAISAIDTGTLTESARYPVTGGLSPASVALVGGKLWFGYAGPDPTDPSGIGSVDLGAATPTAVLDPVPVPVHWYGPPLVVSSPAAPGMLVVGGKGGASLAETATVAVYNVSTGQPGTGAPSIVVGSLSDMAISPDGKELVLASSESISGDQALSHRVFRLADLAEIGQYGDPLESAPDSVAISPDGTVAAGDYSGMNNLSTLGVYAQNDPAQVNDYTFAAGARMDGRALAWGPDGTELFAVTRGRSDPHPVLNIIADHPEQSTTSARISAPATAVAGTAFTMKGAVDTTHLFGADAKVHITRTSTADPRPVALPEATLTNNGRFSFTDAVPTAGSYTYQVTFAGDPLHTAASASTTVQVTRPATTLTVTADAQAYAYGATATLTAHLGATRESRSVSIYAQPNGGSKVLVRTGTVDAHGNLVGRYTVSRDTVVTAVFAGDTDDAPATAAVSVGDHANVQDTLRGYYTSSRSGGTLYRVYHRTTSPVLTVTVSPVKASQCVVFDLQRYYSGGWHNLSSPVCTKLNSASSATTRLARGLPVGALYRIDVTYVRSSADADNLSTTGAWEYFTIRA